MEAYTPFLKIPHLAVINVNVDLKLTRSVETVIAQRGQHISAEIT